MLSLSVAWAVFKKFVKNYWQLLLGLSIGVFFLFLKRDGKLLAGALSLFREEEKNRRDLMLKLTEEESEKKQRALEDYEKNLIRLKEKADKRRREFRTDQDRKIGELVDEESKSPGTIARKIDEAIDND